jgi:tryptophan-rich sensory protein
VVTFWLAIMFGGWPFNSVIKSPVGAGVVMLAAVYIINYLLFRVFFDFSFMAGAPWYKASMDPHGMFNGVNAQVFYVTALTFLFVLLHFDLWPFTLSPAVMKQPVLGIVWTLLSLALGALAYYIGVNTLGMDPMVFLISGPIPFIFGTIVLLNMLHNSLFAKFSQPLKGVLNCIAAAVIGVLLAKMYGALAPAVTGVLKPGPPTNDFEIWLATALLGVTFPFLIFFAEFFKMWPLAKAKPE